MIPVFKPILPGFDALEPFVRIIDETIYILTLDP